MTQEGEANTLHSESTTIPTNPRTSRPVGYAFVALSTPSEAERAIAELNGKAILDRKVSIQLARTPEAHTEGTGSGAEGNAGKILTDAYLNEEMDPFLEFFVTTAGGLTQANFADVLDWWQVTLTDFETTIGY